MQYSWFLIIDMIEEVYLQEGYQVISAYAALQSQKTVSARYCLLALREFVNSKVELNSYITAVRITTHKRACTYENWLL